MIETVSQEHVNPAAGREPRGGLVAVALLRLDQVGELQEKLANTIYRQSSSTQGEDANGTVASVRQL